ERQEYEHGDEQPGAITSRPHGSSCRSSPTSVRAAQDSPSGAAQYLPIVRSTPHASGVATVVRDPATLRCTIRCAVDRMTGCAPSRQARSLGFRHLMPSATRACTLYEDLLHDLAIDCDGASSLPLPARVAPSR